MSTVDRRSFLGLMGVPVIAAASTGSIEKALALPAADRHGSIRDVEHVVILMQENRSFDHYFGTMRGVRGFADPHPAKLPSGKSVWHQPDGAAELLPYRPEVEDVGRAFLPDPPHGWTDGHAAWNGGRHDGYVPAKGIVTMTHHTRADLPYQFALAEAFTLCDNYHCSLLGPTDPNRYHMWTGWVGNDGRNGGPVVDNAEAGYDWSTYPERLQRNGISWKVYQDVGVGLTADGHWGWTSDPFIGNYGDNSLLYFHPYQDAAPGTPLADRARTGTDVAAEGRDPDKLFTRLRADVKSGRLPQVSYVVAPEAYSEHPNWEPDFGAWYVSQVMDILTSDPDLWGRTALFVTYDEDGGFFDHLVPPTPPVGEGGGISTVPTTNEIFPGSATYAAGPYGLGLRVPMIVVSPWTRGGWVNSELFDHTSLIQFLEARFGRGNKDLIESNITPWRRAVTGDLTSAFDFRTPNRSTRLRLPDTDDLKPADLTRQPDLKLVPPADPELPEQERGVRPARALPYTLQVDGRPGPGSFTVTFGNSGPATGTFQVRSADDDPRSYTVGPGRHVSDSWAFEHAYDLEVHGVNGFYRHFAGTGATRLEVAADYDERRTELVLAVHNRGGTMVEVTLSDRYRPGKLDRIPVRPGASVTPRFALSRTRGWYDLAVGAHGDDAFEARFAGHLEDGRDSITDPGMGGVL